MARYLGLCPILAVATTLVRGLTAALLLAFILVLTTLAAAVARHWVTPPLRTLFHALSAAVAAGCAHYGLGVIAPALQESMRWYIALMAMNCLVLSHAEQIGARTSVAIAARDALRVAVAVILTTGVLAGIREVASTGALFGDYAMLFSAAATPPALGGMHLTRLAFPVFAKPAGGLLALGLLVALHRAVIRHWRRSD